ncbi:phage terminase large subunit family protein [Desulfovibrio mangrovi]|uniref:terminase gpA endonuclease subunit n=1 Tax=Desulfovibrio mangrovi TaxID=2976983 RepID=UPI002247F918|nr:terminase gpA endonuclease subunit [Desulfovibrio mangrovi]UZP67729.1 phage terminase large subunit family protein [Desulfovibrio mangrovi]
MQMQPNPPFTFRPAECDVFRRPDAARTVDWAAKHVRIVDGPYKGQPWDPNVLPHVVGALDILDRQEINKAFFIWCSRAAKTTTAEIWSLAEHERHGHNIAMGMADENALNRHFTGSLHELIKGIKPVRAKLHGRNALQKDEVRFADGSAVYGMWAGSDSRTRSFSAAVVLIDEEDVYQDKGIVLAMQERGDEYSKMGLQKIIRACRPKGNDKQSTIWADAETEAHAWLNYECECPGCHTRQVMEHEHLVAMNGSKDPKEIRRDQLGRYKCVACGYTWTDRARTVAMQNGGWVATKGNLDGATVVAFHLRRWETPLVSLSDVLADWFEAQGNPRKLQVWDNNTCAKPYKFIQLEQDENALRKHVSEHMLNGEVPEWTLALTFAADMQKDHFKWSVCAHGVAGSGRMEMIISYGTVVTFDELGKLIFQSRYKTKDGKRELGIWRASLDVGGTKHENQMDSRPVQALLWLSSQRRGVVFPTRGMSRTSPGQLVKQTVVEKLPDGRNLAMGQGGLTMAWIDTDAFKRDIFWRLAEGAGEEPLFFHGQTTDEYLKEIASEKLERDKTGKEAWVRVRANHWLDCLVQHMAMAWWQWSPSLVSMAASLPSGEQPLQREQAKAQKQEDNPWTGGISLFGE